MSISTAEKHIRLPKRGVELFPFPALDASRIFGYNETALLKWIPMFSELAALRYFLFEVPIPLEPLRVLETRQFAWNDWRVRLHILGASHAVCLERDGVQLMELLACIAPQEGESALHIRDAQTAWETCIVSQGLRCRIRLSPVALRDGIGLEGRYACDSLLSVAYPAAPETSIPFTSLGWRSASDSLAIETLHTYPEAGRAVRTTTHFEVS